MYNKIHRNCINMYNIYAFKIKSIEMDYFKYNTVANLKWLPSSYIRHHMDLILKKNLIVEKQTAKKCQLNTSVD